MNEEDQRKAVLEAIESLLDWRVEVDADKIATTNFPRRNAFLKKWPHGMHGLSKDGHIVYIDCPGRIVPSELTADFSMDEYMSLHVRSREG